MAKSDMLLRVQADTKNYDANLAKARRQLEGFKKDNLSASGALKQLSGSLVGAASGFLSVTAAVGALGSAIVSNIETARNFEKSMSQLSSLTGMVGKDLNKLKEYAIELGASTTLSASQVADAFKLIGSQQPQLLASGEALKNVTKNAITLSEAAGIDLQTAAQTLSTSINQMGGDSSNAERFINVLAAASQKGAGDIAWLGTAITNSGTAAKAVGTSYEELVANLEQLAKGGFDASTAGTALRSIIMNLEKQANNDFKPSVVGLTEAFDNLGKANLTIVEYQKIAGKMFASQAKVLADAANEARNMTEAITGTNTAEEQAKTNTDNLDGSLKQLASAWEGLNLHINSSNGLLRTGVDLLTDYVRIVDKAVQKMSILRKPLAGMIGDILDEENTPGNFVIYNPEGSSSASGGSGGGGGGKKTGRKTTKTTPTYADDSIAAQEKLVQDLTKKWKEASASMRDGYLKQLQDAQNKLEDMKNPIDKILKATGGVGGDLVGSIKTFGGLKDGRINVPTEELARMFAEARIASKYAAARVGDTDNPYLHKGEGGIVYVKGSEIADGVASAMSGVVSGLENLGIEIPDQIKGVISAIQGMTTIANAIYTTLCIIKAIDAADAFIPGFARGGIVHAAGGYVVPGNYNSGDLVPAALSSGEVVLNRAQQGILSSALQNGGLSNLHLEASLSGETINLAVKAGNLRRGRGEYVTTKTRKYGYNLDA